MFTQMQLYITEMHDFVCLVRRPMKELRSGWAYTTLKPKRVTMEAPVLR
jgi:hypothetical protein